MTMRPDVFRKRPVEVEAVRCPYGSSPGMRRVAEWCGAKVVRESSGQRVAWLVVETLHGPVRVTPGDWVLRGPSGDFWPCKPEIFAASYEPSLSAVPSTGGTE